MYTIYSKPGCAHCETAKQLLETKGLPFKVTELDVGQVKVPGQDYYTIHQLTARVPNAKTVPQIFKDDELVGGLNGLKKQLGVV